MATARSTNLRHLLLPRGHGAWSRALEPVALGPGFIVAVGLS